MGVLSSSVIKSHRWCHHPISPFCSCDLPATLPDPCHVAGRNFSQGCFQSKQRAQGNSQFFTKTVETISRRNHWLHGGLKNQRCEGFSSNVSTLCITFLVCFHVKLGSFFAPLLIEHDLLPTNTGHILVLSFGTNTSHYWCYCDFGGLSWYLSIT